MSDIEYGVWYRDMQHVQEALKPFVKDDGAGFEYVDTNTTPQALIDIYTELRTIGYGNGFFR